MSQITPDGATPIHDVVSRQTIDDAHELLNEVRNGLAKWDDKLQKVYVNNLIVTANDLQNRVDALQSALNGDNNIFELLDEVTDTTLELGTQAATLFELMQA